jgi:hypothetical protein
VTRELVLTDASVVGGVKGAECGAVRSLVEVRPLRIVHMGGCKIKHSIVKINRLNMGSFRKTYLKEKKNQNKQKQQQQQLLDKLDNWEFRGRI